MVALLFQTKLVTKEFLGSTKDSGNRWGSQAVLFLLHETGCALVRRAKESKCYMPAFLQCKSALWGGSLGNPTGCLFLPGGWQWITINTHSPLQRTLQTLTGLWLLFKMNSESFLHTWHKGQTHLAMGLNLMLMSVYSHIEWWHFRPAKRGWSVAKLLNILNMLLYE